VGERDWAGTQEDQDAGLIRGRAEFTVWFGTGKNLDPLSDLRRARSEISIKLRYGAAEERGSDPT